MACRVDYHGRTMSDSYCKHPVVVVGAGMAGLACARTLAARGIDVVVWEASDRVGGRVGSRVIEGVSCELGFQVSMSNYDRLESLVPRSEVRRHRFISGAMVVEERGRTRIIDPRRNPLAAFSPWRRGLVRLRDLKAVAKCRSLAQNSQAHAAESTRNLVKRLGFSQRFLESFLRPFFGGVLLDEAFDAPASRFLAAFDRFAHGFAELPTGGMQALPDAMAAPLGDRVRLDRAVQSITGTTLHPVRGDSFEASAIVLALPRPQALKLLGIERDRPDDAWNGTFAVHFATDQEMEIDRLIHLNATGTGRLNLVCSPSMVAPGIAPEGTTSILASLRPGLQPPPREARSESFLDEIRVEAGRLLDTNPGTWRHLVTDSIPHALPATTHPSVEPSLPEGVLLAGDWYVNPSIDDAIGSGIACAERLIDGVS